MTGVRTCILKLVSHAKYINNPLYPNKADKSLFALISSITYTNPFKINICLKQLHKSEHCNTFYALYILNNSNNLFLFLAILIN